MHNATTINRDDFVYFTKSIRIPRSKILGVRRSMNGPEAVIETDRGLTTVTETYEEVRNKLYGIEHFGEGK